MEHKVVLKDACKGYTHDQDKVISPEKTVAKFKEKLKKVNLDLLERTVRIDNGRLDIPVYFSVCGEDALNIIGTKKQMGKGGTPYQAEASAVMELAERFSFFSYWKNSSNFLVEEYRNLDRETVIPFETIALSVHDSSCDIEKAKEVFSRLPLKWTWGYNMTTQKEVLIPFDWFYTINEFNGPSAGNCVEEALSQGICEVVERHVSSIISRDKLRSKAINLDSVSDPLTCELIQKYRREGIKLFATDFSLDTGIPSVGVLAYDPFNFPDKGEIVWTAGTTPNPQKALSRALTEVAQLAGDFNTYSNYVASGLPKFRNLDEAEFVINSEGVTDIGNLYDLSNDNIKVEVENCISSLSNIGLDVIVANITHPVLEIPSFYTIIPGAYFRERSAGTSVGMFSAKMISENGDPEWAIDQLDRMVKRMPDKYYVRFFQGVSHLSINEPVKALTYLEKSLELNPKREDIPSIYSYMGQCLKELSQYRKAIHVLRKAETYDSERTDIYNLLGFCYFKLKEHEEAINCFKKVIKLDPSSAIDYANIASNYRDLGNKERAIHYYRLSLEIDPFLEFARENLMKLKENAAI